jgi:hypothetical protein
MSKRYILLLTAFLSATVFAQAQRIWDGDYNRLGLQAGVNHFNIQTDALPITPNMSWTAGFTTWDSFYNDFQFIYGINFFDFKLSMDGREKQSLDSPYSEIPFTMIGVQANFFGSYKIINEYLSVQGGPVLQINGKFDARQDKEYHFIEGYSELNPIDLENISSVNFNLAIGFAGGLEKVKIWLQYQYGVNNMFKKLGDEELVVKEPSLSNLSGHLNIVTGGLIVFL